ncbi:MAG: N-formylglutamate amidohydrolase [Geminicoccaceae bacterium]
MDQRDAFPAYLLSEPEGDDAPLIVSSPHSGEHYPDKMLERSTLSRHYLRRLEDTHVDRLVADAPLCGAWLLRAAFARAYVDLNRDRFELDPRLITGSVPDFVNTASLKARAGLGSVPSQVGGRAIYRRGFDFKHLHERLERAYSPYHNTLETLLHRMLEQFGGAVLLDCHSMPSMPDIGISADIVLGDRFGRSCHHRVLEVAELVLRRHGYKVTRNRPYAGGFITAHYGKPLRNIHAMQIEIRRDLFMDEHSMEPHAGLARMRRHLADLVTELAACAHELARPSDLPQAAE